MILYGFGRKSKGSTPVPPGPQPASDMIVSLNVSDFTGNEYNITNGNLGKLFVVNLTGASVNHTIKLANASELTKGRRTTIVYLAGTVKLIVTTVGGTQNIAESTSVEVVNPHDSISFTDDANKYLISNDSRYRQLLHHIRNINYGVITLPTVTDNEDGSITIGTDGVINFATEPEGKDLFYRINVTHNPTLTIPNNSVAYIYADYNNGNPEYKQTNNPSDYLTDARLAPVFRIIRQGTNLEIFDYDEYGASYANKNLFKDISLNSFQRQSGLVLSTEATRIVKCSEGSVVFGVTRRNILETVSGTHGKMFEYFKTAGVWSANEVTAHDSQYYCDGTNRQTLQANRWVAKYIFRNMGSRCMCYIHGNQYTSAAAALNEALPPVYHLIAAGSLYIGKIVVQEGAIVGTAYPRTFGTGLAIQIAQIHNDMNGRDAENCHPSTAITVDAAGFDGNLDSDVDTVQKLAQAVDDLDIGGGGGISNQSQVSVKGVGSAQSVNGTVTVQFNSEERDSENEFNGTTYKFIPKTDGWFQFNAQVEWGIPVSGTRYVELWIRIVRGASTINRPDVRMTIRSDEAYDPIHLLAQTVRLQKDDEVTIMAYSSNTLLLYRANDTLLTITKVGE